MSSQQAEKLKSIIQSRFFDLMLSEKVARTRLGVYAEAKPFETARELLDIENHALERKTKQAATESEFKEYVNEYFHEMLFEHLEQRAIDTDYLFTEILPIENIIADLIDACAARATTASKYEQLVTGVPFLKDNLITMVNNPPYRAEGSTKTQVHKVGLAVRYIGVENVKFWLMSFIAKNWLPHSTEPYREFKVKFWQYSIASANCARALAKHYQLDDTLAFMYGLFHGVGMSLTMRVYLRAFDKVRLEQMKLLSKANRKDIVKLIDSLELDDRFVSQGMRTFSPIISHQVFKRLGLKFAPLLPAIEELNQQPDFKQLSPLNQLLTQSQSYVQYKMLQKSRLIDLDEAKTFLTASNFNKETMAILNQVNLLKIDITPIH